MHCLLQVLLPFLTKRVKFTGETDSSIIFSGKGNPTLISSRDERDRKLLNKFLNKFLLCINFIESALYHKELCAILWGGSDTPPPVVDVLKSVGKLYKLWMLWIKNDALLLVLFVFGKTLHHCNLFLPRYRRHWKRV